MKTFKLNNMTGGWFVGDFEPVAYRTKDVEAGVKHYNVGKLDDRHYHKIATELTLIVSGKVLMNGQEFVSGDIILLEPNEIVEFEVLEETVTAVVKLPSVMNDKYLI